MTVEKLPLTEDRVAQYHRDGFLLASNLIPEAIARTGEAAMWTVMGMDADDPGTWGHFSDEALATAVQAGFKPQSKLFQFFGNRHPDLLACYTPAMMAAMAQLTGKARDFFPPPTETLIQNVFPSEGEWAWRGAHFDGAVKAKQHETFPGPFVINSIIYLNDIEQRGGGNGRMAGSPQARARIGGIRSREIQIHVAIGTRPESSRYRRSHGTTTQVWRHSVFRAFLRPRRQQKRTRHAPLGLAKPMVKADRGLNG